MISKKIIWLASYPKSGNTWFRIFLANVFSNQAEPVDINSLYDTTIASSRQMFDDTAGIASADLIKEEIERLRPYIYDHIASEAKENLFLKIHDAFTFTKEGRPLTSEKASLKAIYIIRNPFDVAVSLTHHLSVPVEKAVEAMCNENYAFCNHYDRLPNQLEQKLLSWSQHVKSWTDQTILPVKLIRYEDMQTQPEVFPESLNFSGVHVSEEVIAKAIKNSNFNELQKQEKEKGFKERAHGASSFFRKGKVGDWREELPMKCVKKLIDAHFDVMKHYDYIDENGNPIY